jgi:hypothetical protein
MPHVRICGGGDQRWSFLLRLNAYRFRAARILRSVGRLRFDLSNSKPGSTLSTWEITPLISVTYMSSPARSRYPWSTRYCFVLAHGIPPGRRDRQARPDLLSKIHELEPRPLCLISVEEGKGGPKTERKTERTPAGGRVPESENGSAVNQTPLGFPIVL